MGAIAGGTSYLVAWASWHLWETRFLALKERFPYTARPAAAPREPAATPAGAD